MSPFDLNRLTGAGPIRGVSRDLAGTRADARPASAGSQRDGGVIVESTAIPQAGKPPLDTDRIKEIREALRDGTYPIVPAQIADAMIAARLLLSGGQ